MKKFLLILLLIVAVPVLGAIAFIKFADFNDYKPQIEKLVKKYADIDVKINGDLEVAVSLKPTIELNDVDIALPSDGTKMAKIGNAVVQFSIMPLFDKELMIDSVETTDTHIFYGENDSVLINALAADMDAPDEPINLIFNTTVEGVEINGEGKLSSLQSLQKSNFNNLDVDAKIQALGYTLDFVGALQNLTEKMSAAGEYVLGYKSNKINGNITADLEGEVPYIKLDATSAKINASDWLNNKMANSGNWLISSAHAEEYIAGTTLPYSYLKMVNADVTVDLKNVIIDSQTSVQNLRGDASIKNGVFKANIKNADTMGLNVNGSVSLDSPKSLPYLKLNIKGNTLDLRKFSTPEKPQKQSYNFIDWIIPSAHASTLMDNTTIPYQYLKMVNADINLNLQNLIVNPDTKLTDIQTNMVLKNGVLKANVKNINAGGGTVNGTIDVNAQNQTAAANLKADNVILQNLDTAFANPQNSELYIKEGGKTTALVNVITGGQNTDQYLANLNGQIIAFADPSVVKIKNLERLQGNIIVQILQNLKLNITNKEMKLKCAVFRSDIQSGRMNFPKGIVFDANDLYLVADGHINLGDEKINLAIQPFSGKIKDTSISSILGSLLKIKGTINKPKLAINQAATAQSVIGAIATAGAYNVGDMMLSADASPCHTALIGTAYANHFEAKTTVRSTVSDGYTNTKDAVKNLGKGIGDTAKDIGRGLKGLFK